MENIQIKKICPPCSELSGIVKNIQCNEEGCNQIFSTSSHLQMHILKHHKNQSLIKDKNTLWQYHCPTNGCLYSLESEKYFKTKKLLKQHYLKVHAEKKYICSKCQKGFPTEASQKHHTLSCGIKFYCSCSTSFDSYDALYSHTKRYHHALDPKYKLIRTSTETPNDQVNVQPQIIPVNVLALLTICDLPKKTISNALDKEVQTEPGLINNKRCKKSNLGKVSDKSTKRKSSQTQTQTRILSRNKRPKTSTHTQTGDYIVKRSYKNKRKQSMETQTFTDKIIKTPEKSSNIINYNSNLEITLNNGISNNTYNSNNKFKQILPSKPNKSSSATQTSPSSISEIGSTKPKDLTLTFLENDSSENNIQNYVKNNNHFGFMNEIEHLDNIKNNENNFEQVNKLLNSYTIEPPSGSCTIETQTEIDSSNCLITEDFELTANSPTETEFSNEMELLYSNMYTQTCEDILFSDFDFADIETQTAWPQYENDSTNNLVSTETQTAFLDKITNF